MRRKFRVPFTSRSRVCSPATCLCGVRAQRRDEMGPGGTGSERMEKRRREKEQERERERERCEIYGVEDIVFRYLELCVWVFALNRRTRRKTRGLLRPRGLSYQIDAADEGAWGGNWDGPQGLNRFPTSVDWSRGPGMGPIPRCSLVLAT